MSNSIVGNNDPRTGVDEPVQLAEAERIPILTWAGISCVGRRLHYERCLSCVGGWAEIEE